MLRLLLAVGTAALLGLPASAQPPAAPAKAKKVLLLITPAEVNPLLVLPPPPAEGSSRALGEIVEVRGAIAEASPERLAQAKWDDDHRGPELLAPVLGPAYDFKALPATSALLALVQNDAEAVGATAKKDFPRKRPWAVDPTIKTCDPDDNPDTSYPSGHATLGYALALTMVQATPEKAGALMARAADYAYSRQVCGSHFPSDAQASEALATALVYTLPSKPDFRARLTASRAELAAKGLTVR